MLRLTLKYYMDFISFIGNPQNDEFIIIAEKANAPPKELDLFDQRGLVKYRMRDSL